MNEIIISVITFLIISVIVFLSNKYLIKRPKIKVTIQDDGAGSSASERSEYLLIKWNKFFVLNNVTNNSAYNIQFYDLPKNFIVNKNDNINIQGFNESKIKFTFSENIEKDKVISLKHNFNKLLPSYFNELSFGLEYNNENNKKFYTYCNRVNSSEQNKYYIRKVYK
ncbi:MAG TPA: hypothetical protein DHV28_16185 [Ignavibacteriales bacterium]|nr:hypothetical protein [Ignavibacteriales bacterium]